MDKNTVKIPLDSLIAETANKVRSDLDDETVHRYTSRWQDYLKELKAYESQPADAKTLMKPTWPFPAIKVAVAENDGERSHDVVSGAHRVYSARKAGLETIHAEIVEGTPEELIKMAIRANNTHGKPFSADDARQCIIALAEVSPEITTCRELAKLIGCSKSLVNLIQNSLSLSGISSPHRSTSVKKKIRKRAKPKTETETEYDAEDEAETSEGDVQWSVSQICEDLLCTIQDSEKPDKATSDSLRRLAAGIVSFLAEHGSIKSLQKKLAAIE